MSSTSPTLGVSYAILPVLTLYTNVSNGFQTPTTTELANRPSGAGGFNPALQPERTHSHEAGVKGRARDFSYDFAAYDMRIDDELIPFEVPSAAGRQFYRNAGTARHRGVDADATAQMGYSTRLHASYSFTDARYVTYAVTSGANTTSYATNRVPGIAPQLASLSLDVGDPASRFISIEERYRSNIPVNDANTAYSRASATTNLRASIRVGAVSPFAGVGNLFGVVYNTSVSVNATGGRYFDPAAGRTIYAGVDLLRVAR
jgi:iron complex outermembrane recepter protein